MIAVSKFSPHGGGGPRPRGGRVQANARDSAQPLLWLFFAPLHQTSASLRPVPLPLWGRI